MSSPSQSLSLSDSTKGSSAQPREQAAVETKDATPICSFFVEDLIAEGLKSSSTCGSCGQATGKHARKPTVPVLAPLLNSATNSESHSSSGWKLTNVVGLLPKWKVDFKAVRPFLQRFEQVLTAAKCPEKDFARHLLLSVSDVSEGNWIQRNIITPNLAWTAAKIAFTEHFELVEHNTIVI